MSSLKRGVIVSAAVLGAGALGVVAGLLLAPASGAETRRRISRRIEDEAEVLRRKAGRPWNTSASVPRSAWPKGRAKSAS